MCYHFGVDHFVLENQLWGSSLREANSLFSGQSLVAGGSLSRVGILWDFLPLELACLLELSLFSFYLRSQSFSKLSGPPALTVFLPHLPWCTLGRRYRSCVVDISTEARLSWWLHHALLWFSIMDSICCKERFLWWYVTIKLICGCSSKILDLTNPEDLARFTVPGMIFFLLSGPEV